MATAFGTLLYELIDRAGLSVRTFARQVDTHASTLSDIKSGKRSAPLPQLDRWAELLGLLPGTPQHDRFMYLATVTHLPEDHQARFVALLSEHYRLIAENEQLRTIAGTSRSSARAAEPRRPYRAK